MYRMHVYFFIRQKDVDFRVLYGSYKKSSNYRYMAEEGTVNGNRRKRERTIWTHIGPYGPVYHLYCF